GRRVGGGGRGLGPRRARRGPPRGASGGGQHLENPGEETADDAAPDAALEKQDATWRAVVHPRHALRAGPLLSSLHRGGGMYVRRRAVVNQSGANRAPIGRLITKPSAESQRAGRRAVRPSA